MTEAGLADKAEVHRQGFGTVVVIELEHEGNLNTLLVEGELAGS